MELPSIKSNLFYNTLKIFATLALPLITLPYTSRVLGPDGIGKVNFALALSGYFTILASIGIPLYAAREISRVRNDNYEKSRVIQEMFILHFLASLIMSFAYILTVLFISKDQREILLISGASILLTSFSIEWYFEGTENYRFISLRNILFSVIYTIFVFLVVRNSSDLTNLIFLGILIMIGKAITNLYQSRKSFRFLKFSELRFKRHLKGLFTLFTFNLIVSVYIHLDTVILGLLSSSDSVAYYSIGMKLNKIILSLVTASSIVILPRLSYLSSTNQKADFLTLFDSIVRMFLIVALPIVIAFYSLGKQIIILISDYSFLPAYNVLIITAPTILFVGISNIITTNILIPNGDEKKILLPVGVGAITSLVLNLELIPIYHHIGAALSTFFAEFFVFVLLIIMARKEITKLKLSSYLVYFYTSFVLLLFILAMIFVLDEFYLLFICLVVGSFIYLFLLYYLKEPLVKRIVDYLYFMFHKLYKKVIK